MIQIMNLTRRISLLLLLSVYSTAHAVDSGDWENISDVGVYSLVATAIILPVYKEDWLGFRQAAYSIGTASGVALLGKSVIDAERPDNSGNDSFPSGHTANAFAAATTLNLRYGWRIGFPAYGVSTLVGVARVEANKHYWRDVIGGAAIGSLAAWLFTDAVDEHIQIAPWAGRQDAGKMISMRC